MKVIQNKEEMISYCHLKKIEKKTRTSQNQAEIGQKVVKIGKNWNYVHFDPKITKKIEK